MKEASKSKVTFDDLKLHVKVKLSALWASLMFCYIYGDYFGLFIPGKVTDLQNGLAGWGNITQSSLAVVSFLMALPALMVFLSLVLNPKINRWANILLGLIFVAGMLLTLQGAWLFYQIYTCIELVLVMLIIWHAWTWPKTNLSAI
jgi:hypothetical protein